MTCAAVTVNRSLILLAIAWGVIPVAAFQAVTMTGKDDVAAAGSVLESGQPCVALPSDPSESLPCKLGEAVGLIPVLSLAITQPNHKNAWVPSGR